MELLRLWVGIAVALVLIGGCGGGAASNQREADQQSPSLVGTRWHWVGSTESAAVDEVAEPNRYTLLLHRDGGAEFRFDCNRGRGSYEMEGEQLRFGPIMTTRMACPEDSRDFDFGRQLDAVASFSLEGGELRLWLKPEGDVMRFRAETD